MRELKLSHVSKRGHKWYPATYLALSHYLNQFWHIANWTLRNKLQSSLKQNISWKMSSILPRHQCFIIIFVPKEHVFCYTTSKLMVLSLLINNLASQGSIILKWYSYYRHIHFYFCLFSGLAPSPWCGGPWGLWRGCFARDTATRDDVSERRSGSWQPEWWRRYGERHTGPSGPVPEKYRRAYGELFIQHIEAWTKTSPFT